MPRPYDLIGQRFSRLTVTSRERSGKTGVVLWKCQCDCGSVVSVPTSNLTTGHTRSCGCIRVEVTASRNKGRKGKPRLPRGEASFNALVKNYRAHAARRRCVWELTRDQCRVLFTSNCYYCGVSPQSEYFSCGSDTGFIYNGIDRVDNHKGYTAGNTVPCCGQCNVAKNHHSFDDWREWVVRISQHYKSTNGWSAHGQRD